MLNRKKCTIVTIDKAGKLPIFTFVPDLEKKTATAYLGTYFTNNGNNKNEIKRQTGMAKSAPPGRLRKNTERSFSIKTTKNRLMRSLVFSIAFYDSESWTLNKTLCRKPKTRSF